MQLVHAGLQAFIFIVLAIYFTWFWSHGGQTVAMKTWHIRLVDTRGLAVSQLRAFARYVLAWLWFLPPLAALAAVRLSAVERVAAVIAWVLVWALLSRLHPQRQFWHDAMAGTRLVTAPALAP